MSTLRTPGPAPSDAALGKSHQPPRLSVLEYIQLLAFKVPLISGRMSLYVILRLFSSLYRAANSVRSPPAPRAASQLGRKTQRRFGPEIVSTYIRRTLLLSFLDAVMRTLSMREMQAMQQPSGDAIASYCFRNKDKILHERVLITVPPATPDLARQKSTFPPAALHFLKNHAPSTDIATDWTLGSSQPGGSLLLYFHGGGYVAPLGPQYPAFAQALGQAVPGESCTVACLEYTLAPGLSYPGQLAQAVAALEYLLVEAKWKPSQLVIGGDSAGGNLTLALLAHLHRPHPQIKPLHLSTRKDQSTERLRAAFAISPRCSNDTSADSYRRNAGRDMISLMSMRLFTSHWRPAPGEVWAMPAAGDADFWAATLDETTAKMAILSGSLETYTDDIYDVAQKLKTVDARRQEKTVFYAECAGEIHVQAVLDYAQSKSDGIMLSALMDWMKSL